MPASWRVVNPGGRHAIAAGVDAAVEVEIDGHAGYYCAGMNKQATIRVRGNVGVGVAENMMSGRVVVDGSASQAAGATGHGGLSSFTATPRHGAASRSRAATSSSAGRSVTWAGSWHSVAGSSCAATPVTRLGDSVYEARFYVRGSVAGLGADCVEKELASGTPGRTAGAPGAGRDRCRCRASSAATARPGSCTHSTSTTRARTEWPHAQSRAFV